MAADHGSLVDVFDLHDFCLQDQLALGSAQALWRERGERERGGRERKRGGGERDESETRW